MIPCSYRALSCLTDLPSCTAFYTISVRQTRDLPVVSLFPHPASFRFHLTMDTLAFGYILPTTGRIRDLHPLETCAARRTKSKECCPVPDSILCRLIDVLILTPPVQLTRRYSLFSYKPHSPLQSPHCRTRRNCGPEVPSEHRRLPDTWA